MANRADWFGKRTLGMTLEEATRRPSMEQTVKLWREHLTGPVPPFIIGTAAGGLTPYFTEPDRKDHFHVMGAPDQGKSKFLEMVMCQDILNLQNPKISFESAFAFFDAGPNANTMRKVLNFCVKRKFKKVLIVDPRLISKHRWVPCINPIDYEALPDDAASHLMNSVRVLWNTKQPSDEAIISKYLPKVFRALHNARVTLPDSACFTEPLLERQLEQVLDYQETDQEGKVTRKLDLLSYAALTRAQKGSDWKDFQSTCRRLDPFFSADVFKLLFGSTTGIDFKDLLRNGWIILVNLNPEGAFQEEHARLLGIIMINEIARAMLSLMNEGKGYNIPFNIFIDEIGLFATRQMSTILDYYRHLNIRFTFAHQRSGQIEDPYVFSAIRSGAKNKLLFYTSNHADRYQMCQDMNYGGELPVQQVTYTLGSTPKQEAVVRIGKQAPVLTRIRFWPDAEVDDSEVQEYLKELFTSNPHLYRPVKDIWGEIKQRFEIRPPRSNAAQFSGKVSKGPTPSNDTAGIKNKRMGDESSAVEDAPVEGGRNRGSVSVKPERKKPERQKGVPSSLLPKHPRDDEPVGG